MERFRQPMGCPLLYVFACESVAVPLREIMPAALPARRVFADRSPPAAATKTPAQASGEAHDDKPPTAIHPIEAATFPTPFPFWDCEGIIACHRKGGQASPLSTPLSGQHVDIMLKRVVRARYYAVNVVDELIHRSFSTFRIKNFNCAICDD